MVRAWVNWRVSERKAVAAYEHADKTRLNNPLVGQVTPEAAPDGGAKRYAYDPHLDPQLARKAEHTSFQVPTVSLHVHERIDPRTLVEAVRRDRATSRAPSSPAMTGAGAQPASPPRCGQNVVPASSPSTTTSSRTSAAP